MNSVQEIINSVQNLPFEEQRSVLEFLQTNIVRSPSGTLSEDEVEQILKVRGVISEIPERAIDDEEESYEPVEISGQLLSETILEERH